MVYGGKGISLPPLFTAFYSLLSESFQFHLALVKVGKSVYYFLLGFMFVMPVQCTLKVYIIQHVTVNLNTLCLLWQIYNL